MTDPKLNPTTLTTIWESGFSKYVTEHYGRPYKLQQQGDMLAQGSYVQITVPDEEAWDENPTLAEWQAATPPGEHPEGGYDPNVSTENMRWERDYYPSLEVVANDLHAKGLLDAGEYLIRVYW